MASPYEEAYDKAREKVADYTYDELLDERDRLDRQGPHLSTEDIALQDAIAEELSDRP